MSEVSIIEPVSLNEQQTVSGHVEPVVSWWRDLVVGEQLNAGDRFINQNGKWEVFTDADLEYSNVVSTHTRPCQRKQNEYKK